MLRWGGRLLAAALLLLFLTPLALLLTSVSRADLARALDGGLMGLLGHSLALTIASLVAIVLAGTPLSWWIARHPGRLTRAAEVSVRLPLAAPPAVLGIALSTAFGAGFPAEMALVVAQVCVAAPYFVLPTTAAFRTLDPELLWTARSLGSSPAAVFTRVAVPLASPAALEGLAISSARALGELGAAHFLVGAVGLTMPLSLLRTEDVGVQRATAVALLLAAGVVYFAVRSKVSHRLLGRQA
ncbi:MAG: ABC transporter permease subunit [Sandaracinaceae bacterium]